MKKGHPQPVGFGDFFVKMKNRWLIIIYLVVPLLFSSISAQGAARTVIDQMGRKVTIALDPQRVVSLSPSITENIFAIGQEYRLKGITRFSDYPPDNLEKIVALKPDLCIALKDGNPIGIIDRLESLNIPVFATDPRNLDGVLETIREIGLILNSKDKAKLLVNKLQARIDKVKFLVAKTDTKPRVFFQIGITPIVSAGTNTFINELITLAGGENVSAGATPYPRFSREQVLGLEPEVFIITSMARGGDFEEMKAWWSRWPNMPAVRNNRIYLMDSNVLDRATPRMVDGLEMLLQHIHPGMIEETK